MDDDIRRQGITGTDIAAICGLNPYRSAFRVWEEKTGKAEPVETTPQMEWGTILEPIVAEHYTIEHPEMADELQPNVQTIRHDEYPLVVGTPDYLMPQSKCGLEIKTAGVHAAKGFGPSGSAEVPKHHYLQCEWYMILMGWESWQLAALIGGQDYRKYQFTRKAELDKRLLELATTFWERYVQPDTPPPLDGSKSVADYLARTYPTHTDALPVATPEQTETFREYWYHRRARDEHQEEVDRLANILKFHIGDRAGLLFDCGRVTWKRCKDSERIDWKGVAIAAGATNKHIAASTTTRPGVRRFLAKFDEDAADSKYVQIPYR